MERDDLRSAMAEKVKQLDGEQIDPGKWWGEKSTSQAILLGLGAAVTGWANGRAGIAGNPVIQGIDRAIERDIESQVRNRDHKKGQVRELGQLHALALQESGDEKQAMFEAKQAGITLAQNQVRAKAMAADSPLAQEKGLAMIAALERLKVEKQAENDLRLKQEVASAERFVPRQVAGGGMSDLQKLHLAQQMSAFNAGLAPKPGQEQATMVLGKDVIPLDPTLSPTEREKARAGASYLTLAREQFEQAQRLRGTGIGVADSDVQSALKNGAEYFSKAKDMGVVTGGEWEVTKDLYRGVGADKALTQVLGTIDRQARAHTVQYGAQKRLP